LDSVSQLIDHTGTKLLHTGVVEQLKVCFQFKQFVQPFFYNMIRDESHPDPGHANLYATGTLISSLPTYFSYKYLKVASRQCCGFGMISSQIWPNFIQNPGFYYLREKGKFFKTARKAFLMS
jgi:hypothetical protein